MKKWIDYPREGISPSQLTISPDDAVWFINSYHDVYRFDEKDWTQYTRENELAGTSPRQILVAPDGALWFVSDEAWIRYQP
jgi:streptogramin lyase